MFIICFVSFGLTDDICDLYKELSTVSSAVGSALSFFSVPISTRIALGLLPS